MANTNTNDQGKSQGKGKQGSYGKKKHYQNRDKGMPKDSKENCVARRVGEENDPSWYNSDGQLVRDAASVSFYTPAGSRYYINDLGFEISAIPGIMTFNVVPGPGKSTSKTSAVNLAALRLYTNMRKNNSGAANYSHSDMMMYALAIDSVYCFYAEMLRLYGVMNSWNQYNRYQPQYIVQALGYDYNDFRKNLSNFRAWLNLFIKRANAFSLPVSFTISKRHTWMFSNIWKDSTNEKAQLYIYKPFGYYTWEDAAVDSGTLLQWRTISKYQHGGGLITFDTVRTFGDLMLDKLWNSEDVAIIGGDLERAYGTQNLFNLAYCDEAYVLEPTFSEEVLMQIENSDYGYGTQIPDDIDQTASSWCVSQDVGRNIIVYDPHLKYGKTRTYNEKFADFRHVLLSHGRPINVHFTEPDPDDVMVATRNMVSYDINKEDAKGQGVTFRDLASEFIAGVDIYYMITNEDGEYVLSSIPVLPYFDDSITESTTLNFATVMTLISTFDWHPIVYVHNSTDGISTFLWDFDNYSKIASSTLHKMPR